TTSDSRWRRSCEHGDLFDGRVAVARAGEQGLGILVEAGIDAECLELDPEPIEGADPDRAHHDQTSTEVAAGFCSGAQVRAIRENTCNQLDLASVVIRTDSRSVCRGERP
ncbi:MAG: hypothetical protein JKY37_14685, partial [Nannocystaceae bacterium]|nr:hypothetical protein [Nannocystaceae bacterium]